MTTEATAMLEAAKDDLRLRYCRQGRHSYFGPICMVCGHDLMRQLKGERCGDACEICKPSAK